MGIRTGSRMKCKRDCLSHVVFDVEIRIHFLCTIPIGGITLQTYGGILYLVHLFSNCIIFLSELPISWTER
jgi:hypothetical protein